MVALIPFLAAFLAALAECVHWLRCRAVARMAFRRAGRGLVVVLLASAVRVGGVTVTASALPLLWRSSSVIRNGIGAVASPGELDRMIVIMDASKSMNLEDAGPDGTESRASRARTLIYQLISRANRMPRTTLMTFGESTLPVVYDAKDWDVLSNVLLRQYYSKSFDSEETHIDSAVQYSLRLADSWIPNSTVVVLVTDGDSQDGEQSCDRFDVPPSVRRFVAIGVGSPEGRPAGPKLTEISRLGADNLRRIARLAGGDYFDGTRELLPADYVDQLLPPPRPNMPPQSQRDFALILLAAGVSLLAFLQPALSLAEKRLLQP